MEQGQGEANTMDREDTIAFALLAIHLDVVETPFLDEFDDEVCLHNPC